MLCNQIVLIRSDSFCMLPQDHQFPADGLCMCSSKYELIFPLEAAMYLSKLPSAQFKSHQGIHCINYRCRFR